MFVLTVILRVVSIAENGYYVGNLIFVILVCVSIVLTEYYRCRNGNIFVTISINVC